jgi:phosphoglycolate phosphatase-like HAD superfamily hydrolase
MHTTAAAARIHIQPGFCWDAQNAYLFDIDGTLLRDRGRTHMTSFLPSIQQASGFELSLEGVPVQGSTDTAIIREAFRRAAVPEEVVNQHFEAILEALRQMVAARRSSFDVPLMPGVVETLRHLADKGALLGVATGNLEEIGWIKLEEAGIRDWFRFGGFSDKFPVRSELIGAAASKARAIAGPEASVCIVGDTPRDIEAAHANGLPVVAIATHQFSFDELLEHSPEVCATSLADLLAWTAANPMQVQP